MIKNYLLVLLVLYLSVSSHAFDNKVESNSAKLEFSMHMVPTDQTALNNQQAVKMTYFRNELSIKGYTGKGTIEVYDILGKLVTKKTVSHINNNTTVAFNLPPKKIFLIRLTTDTFSQTIKILS